MEGQNVNVLLVTPENKIFLGFNSGELIICSFDKLSTADVTGKFLGDEVKVPEFLLPVDHVLRAH